jgi:hypothetical protein
LAAPTGPVRARETASDGYRRALAAHQQVALVERQTAAMRALSAQQAARRHRIQQVRARTERFEGEWQAPSSLPVQRDVEKAFAQVREVANGGRGQDQDHAADDQAPPLELSKQDLDDLRATAEGQLMLGETDLITGTVNAMGLEAAKRIYGEDLVHRAQQLARAARSSHMTITHR